MVSWIEQELSKPPMGSAKRLFFQKWLQQRLFVGTDAFPLVSIDTQHETYSRSPKYPTLQLSQKSSRTASTRPIWNTAGTVAVRDFRENGCMHCVLVQGRRCEVSIQDSARSRRVWRRAGFPITEEYKDGRGGSCSRFLLLQAGKWVPKCLETGKDGHAIDDDYGPAALVPMSLARPSQPWWSCT